MEQWLETLEYFDYKCAYCEKKEYEVIEHYLPIRIAGTTVSNCVPACLSCNVLKDVQNHSLSLYQNERVLAFIQSKGVKKSHFTFMNTKRPGKRGLAMEKAQEYIDEFYQNTGYAYIS